MASRTHIDEYLANILSAVYGEEVRSSIHDSIAAMRQVVEEDVTTVAYDLTTAPTDSLAAAGALAVFNTALLYKGVLDSCDLNSVESSGIYRLSSNKTYTNTPRELKTGWLIVFSYGSSGNSVTQWLIESGTSSKKNYEDYLRTANTSSTPHTWGAWQSNGLTPDTTLTQEGVPADAKAVGDRLADLSYSPFEIESFTVEPAYQELGSVLQYPTVKWKLNKAPTSANSPTVKAGSNTAVALPLNKSGTYTFTAQQNVQGSTAFTMTVRDEGSPSVPAKNVTATFRLIFSLSVYYGAAKEPTDGYNSAFINSLTSSPQPFREKTFTVTCGTGQYIYFALPKGYGTPVFKDAATNLTGGFKPITDETGKAIEYAHTNASGHTGENYYIYRSDNHSLGKTTIIVS